MPPQIINISSQILGSNYNWFNRKDNLSSVCIIYDAMVPTLKTTSSFERKSNNMPNIILF